MKLLVNISIPAMSAQYDVWVHDYMLVGEIIPLIADAVYELSDHKYVSSGDEFLCLKGSDILMKNDCPLLAYKIKNGDHLVFI